MGETSETTMQLQKKKQKKKGRPSLLDLQKRSLKQQKQQQDPNSFNLISIPTRRSIRRNPFPDEPECFSGEDDERKKKKHKLLNGLDPHPYYPTLSPNSSTLDLNPDGSYSNANIEDTEAALNRRKISVFNHGSDAVVMIINSFSRKSYFFKSDFLKSFWGTEIYMQYAIELPFAFRKVWIVWESARNFMVFWWWAH